MLLNRNVYETFMIVISWVYILMCIIEPGNRAERPYEPKDSVFKFVVTLEGIIQLIFAIDSII